MSGPFERVLEETLVAFLALQELGFCEGELYADTRNVANANPRGPWATVTARRAGKEFVIAIAPLLDDAACRGYPHAWHSMCQRPMPKREAIRLVQRSRLDLDRLLDGLTEAGFSVELGGPP